MQYLDWILSRYGLEGILLATAFIILFVMQVWRYAWLCKRTAGTLLPPRADRHYAERPHNTDGMPAVSVVVPLFTADPLFLEEGLMRLLAQEYEYYEVVVVYVGRDEDFYDELLRMRLSFPNLRTTKIEVRPRYPITPKMALNIGIKSSRNPYIIITTADAAPQSSHWLAIMADGFKYGDIVTGYCGIEQGRGLLNRMLRTDRMMSSAQWLAAAASGRPYRGHKCNLGFAKHLYFGVNGFGHLNMDVGEDDLFMQRIMTPDNTVTVISPEASVAESIRGGMHSLLKQRRHEAEAQKLYPCEVRHSLRIEPCSRILFFITAAAIFITMPWEYCLAAAVLAAARFVTVCISAARIARRTGEHGLTASYILYDLLWPFADTAIRAASRRKSNHAWRYTNIS